MSKFFITFLLLMGLQSCKPLHIEQAFKQKLISGISKKSSIKYSLVIEVRKPIRLESIVLPSTNKKIENISIYDLSNGKILSKEEVLMQGTYTITAPGDNRNLSEDSYLYLHYNYRDRFFRLKSNFYIKEDLNMKTTNQ